MKKSTFVYAMPNRYPYNELLLSGKLSAKTRTWKWNHTGLTLLYTSEKSDDDVLWAHDLSKKHESGVLVGYGMLEPVRLNSEEECGLLEDEFYNADNLRYYDFDRLISAGPWRYQFTDLQRFKKPISFKPKPGSVRVFRVPAELLKGKIPAKLLTAGKIRVK